MSALPSAPLSLCASAPPAPRGARWIAIDEAADLLKKVEGHVARLCRSTWSERGVAELRTPPDGGKKIWHVRTDAHPLLSPAPAPEHLPFDASQLTAKHRQLLELRQWIVQEWDARLSAGHKLGLTESKVTASFIDALLVEKNVTLSTRTLYNWRAAFRERGRAGLVDERWTSDRRRDPADPFIQEMARWWLDQGQPSKAVAYRLASAVARQNGWAIPSPRVANRELQKLPRAKIVLARQGKEAHNNLCAPYHERDYRGLSSNQIWCGDHHPCDVMVLHKGKICRPWLTVWQDMRSRKITGCAIYAEDPNRNAIILAFRLGCLVNGVPESVYVDNGKDYDCYALNGITKLERRRLKVTNDVPTLGGIFGGMHVQVTHAPPYHPQSKPVERFFRTFEDQFGRLQPTYCGNKPDEKPERLAELLKNPDHLPTLDDYQRAALDWIANIYNHQPHTGQGMRAEDLASLPSPGTPGEGQGGGQLTPNEVFDRSFLRPRKTTTADDLDLYCSEPSRPIKVGRNGVRLGSKTYGRGEPLLMNQWLGKQVVLRVDPLDVTHGHVWTIEGKLICPVKLDGLTPFKMSDQEYRQSQKQLQHARKVQKQYADTRAIRATRDAAQLVFANRADEQRRRQESLQLPAAKPVESRPLETPLAAGLKQLQNPFRLIAPPPESNVPRTPDTRFTYARVVAAGPTDDLADAAPAPSFRELMLNRPSTPEEETL